MSLGRVAVNMGGALFAAAPTLAQAQQLGGAPDLELPLLRLGVGLVLCALIAVVAGVALKRFIRNGSANPIGGLRVLMRATPRKVRVIETHRISPHADVCVLACDRREYVVVVSPSGATVIRETDESAEASAS